jgi:hypothetical protein
MSLKALFLENNSMVLNLIWLSDPVSAGVTLQRTGHNLTLENECKLS